MTFFVMLLWIFLLAAVPPVFPREMTPAELEEKIISSMYIERRINSFIRPHPNESFVGPVVVSVNLHILHLSVDATNQNFDISVYFRQEWNDSRVSYDGKDIIDSVNFHDVIGFWTPDLFFVNEHNSHFHIVTKPNTFARIYPDGRVLLSQRLSVKASCGMNLRRYPFDRQKCPLQIESYGYQSRDLLVHWKNSKSPITGSPNVIGYEASFDHRSYVADSGTSESAVGNSKSEINVAWDDASFSSAELHINLRRLVTDFILHLYIPITLFVATSWIPFWMTSKRPGLRLALSLTAIVSCYMQLGINNHLFINPGYATALDVWVAFCCGIIFAAFFANLYVIYTRQDGSGDKSDGSDRKGDGRSLANLLAMITTRMDFTAKIAFPAAFTSFQLFYIIYIISDSSVR